MPVMSSAAASLNSASKSRSMWDLFWHLSTMGLRGVLVCARLSFSVSDVQYVVTFGVMLLVGLLTGQLTAGLRFQARISASRERRAQSLFELTRDLSAALLSEQVKELGENAVRAHFGGDALVLPTDARDELLLPETGPAGFDRGVAEDEGRVAGAAAHHPVVHAEQHRVLAPVGGGQREHLGHQLDALAADAGEDGERAHCLRESAAR